MFHFVCCEPVFCPIQRNSNHREGLLPKAVLKHLAIDRVPKKQIVSLDSLDWAFRLGWL